MRATSRQPADRPGTPARARRALQDAGWTAAIVLPCALVAILTTRLLGPLALFWPANAVLLGMLLRHPERASAAGWLGALVAFLAADRIAGTGWVPTLWLNLANMTGVGAGYLVATRLLPAGALRLDQPRAMLSMLVVCLAGAAAEALVGGSAGPVLFGRGLVPSLLDWFNGQLAMDIILLPLFLAAPRPRPLGGLLARLSRFRKSGNRSCGKNLRQNKNLSGRSVGPPTQVCLGAPVRWHSHDVLPVAALALSLAGAIVLGGPGVLALPVPALIWCALRYPVFPTLVLTALMSTAQLFAIALGLLRLPDIDLLYINSILSARLGIALVALGPMAVAIVNGARNDLLHRLDHLARHDHLTGVLRRGAFLDRAGALLAESAAAGQPVAVLMIDVDHFKRVNDRFGHAGGDRVLAAVAAALQAELPRDAILGRLGGEEFAVLLPGAGPAQARTAAERLRRQVAALSLPDAIEADGPPPAGVTASFGLAACDAGRPQTLERLLARADAALYAAKAAGRNRVEDAGVPTADPGSLRPSA